MLTYKKCRWSCISKVRLIVPLTPQQLLAFRKEKKWSKKPLVYQFREKLFACIQQRRRSASAPAQFYQLSLESMIAKPAACKKKLKNPVRHASADPVNSNGVWGGGSNCFSKEVRTSFSSRKRMATYDFHGEVRTPCPLCLRPYQSFKQFEFTFFFFLLGLVTSQNVC